MESDVYTSVLDAAGVDWLRPEPEEREEISRIIMDELVYGEIRPASTGYFLSLIDRMRDRGCDVVILGCTEIPLMASDASSPLPTLNSTRLLAVAAIQHSLGKVGAT